MLLRLDACLESMLVAGVGNRRVVVHTSVPLLLQRLILEVHAGDCGCRYLPVPTTK